MVKVGTDPIRVGIIGGTGIYNPAMFDKVRTVHVDTPFGMPSDPLIIGEHDGREVVFLSRHGAGHRFYPSEVNSRANIMALKKLGVTHIISASAVGSLREDLRPLDIVIPDQVFDRTKSRPSTFFEDGIVAHISFADPFCPELSRILYDVAKAKYPAHNKGTYLCMEGPQFSTKAESNVYRKLGFDIIGMTALPEAKLAREAEMCYAIVATITDYDVWHEEPVSIEQVVENAIRNEKAVQDIILTAIGRIPEKPACQCSNALSGAIATSLEAIPVETRRKLDVLLDRHMRK
jgi:5'-methylthioadenosine phosphorylase